MRTDGAVGAKGYAVASYRAGRLAAIASPYYLLWYIGAATVMGATPVAAAWLLKLIVDSLTRDTGITVGVQMLYVAGLTLTAVVLGTLPHAMRYTQNELRRKVTILAQDELYTAVNRLDGLSRFEDPSYHDRIDLARQAGLDAPSQLLRSTSAIVQGVVTMLGFLGTLYLLSLPLTLLVLAATVPSLLARLSVSRHYARMAESTTPMLRRHLFFASLLTDLQAVKEVRLNGTGDFLRNRVLAEQRKSNHRHAAAERRDVLTQGGLSILSAGISGTALAWGVLSARQGTITVGDVAVLIAAVAGVQGALAEIVGGLGEAHQAVVLFNHYVRVVDDGPDLALPTATVAVPRLRSGIEFDNIWFRYSPEHPWVLRGVNLVIPAGKACALVGVNGSGKSTLVKLICRFYDPQHGAIRWDGIDLRQVEPSDLRKRLGVLFQDFMKYDLTARENIALGDLDSLVDTTRIEGAAKRAGVHETLSGLPNGYETMLSRTFLGDADDKDPDTGVLLSGGQWQRVALARTLLRVEDDLLVLDEPSSGLDAAAEFEFHTRLREQRRGKTSVLISHRLGALRDSDIIVVLRDGRVVEQATHEELIQVPGEYRRLFQLQAKGYGTSARSSALGLDPPANG